MFNAKFDVLLYDLTSSYFEIHPPTAQDDKRKFGYSRDKRPDCPQVVIALIVTPEGFPLGYEVMAGNTSDKTTLKGFLEQIEKQYGKAQRIWVMDRGIPTEETLEYMRQSDPPVLYLVGTPKGRLSQLEGQLSQLPWQQGWPGIEQAAITGLAFGTIVMVTRKLPFAMIAHSAFDLTALALIYTNTETQVAHWFLR